MRKEHLITVRFRDTDMMGHVNNSMYFTYMEEARIAFVHDFFVGDREIPLILASAAVNFRAQTFYGQSLIVSSWISRIGNSSFDIACEMHHQDTLQLAFDAVATIVCFDYEKQRAVPIADDLRDRMKEYMS